MSRSITADEDGDVKVHFDTDIASKVKVLIRKKKLKQSEFGYWEFEIPMTALAEIIADVVRAEKIRRLEEALTEDVLGIPEER